MNENSNIFKSLLNFLNTLFSILLTLFGLLLVTFFISRVIPIDPVITIVGRHAPPDVYDRVWNELGLGLPLHIQFFKYLNNVIQGDLGVSILTGQTVLEDIYQFFPATLELSTYATLIGIFIGIPLGVIAAVWHNQWPDHGIRIISLTGYSTPFFWLGLMALMLFYSKLGWVGGPGRVDIIYEDVVPPITGMLTLDSLISYKFKVFLNALHHIILPASLLGFFSLSYIARMTRSFMLEQLGQEYIVTARIKGVSEFNVVWGHAFKNILIPLITVVTLSYAILLEGAVLTETIFAWPGLGMYITNSLFSADMPAVLGGTLIIGFSFVTLNLFSDLLYKVFDRRVE